jgi:menaquinone-dependent protoporphyrinogen oxidase
MQFLLSFDKLKKDCSFESDTLEERVLTDKKVLIVYGTRFGSTEGISEKIAALIKEKGIKADIFNLKKTSDKNIPTFDRYDGILIGTGIKVGQWTKEVKDFINTHKDALNSFRGAKGFFVSSGFAADPEKYEKIKIEYAKGALEKAGVKVDCFDAFGGLMDFTKSSKMSWLDKKILKSVAKNDPKLDFNGWNDLRDWKKIEKFAQGFIDLLDIA